MGEDAERKKEIQGNSLLEAPDKEVCADHDVVSLGLGAHNVVDEELRRDQQQPVTDSRLDNPHSPLGPGPVHVQVLSLEESSAEARRPFPPSTQLSSELHFSTA